MKPLNCLKAIFQEIRILWVASIPYSQVAAAVKELLEQFTEAEATSFGSFRCNILLYPFLLNGTARGYPLVQVQARWKTKNMKNVAHWSIFCALQDPDWAGWALPAGPEGHLLHCDLYCQDVLKFAETFLERTNIGQRRLKPRSLDSLNPPEVRGKSLEDLNKALIDQSFFCRGFATVREQQEMVGVQYEAVLGSTLRNETLRLVSRLGKGTLQFFDYAQTAGPGARSVWVSAEGGGWFYVLTYKVAEVGQSRFTTPTWILQARFCHI